MIIWKRDDGYSCEETARRGNYAAVIVPPEYLDCDGRWGYQIFDEADEDAMGRGEWKAEAHGISDKETARLLAEAALEELADGGSPRTQYQEHEIMALLGDYADDYDIDALVDEITVVDPRTGNRYYTEEYRSLDDDGLAQLLDRHEISANE